MVVTTNYNETTGGLEGHVQRLMPLLVQRGVDVTVVYLGTRRPPFVDDDGVHVHPLQRRVDFRSIMALPSPVEWRRFERAAQAGDLGAVTHISTQTRFFVTSWLGLRLGRKLGVPVVHTEHGGGYVQTSSRFVEACAKAVDLTMGRAVLRGATRVLAVSEASCRFVKRLSGVVAQQFNNGVDLDRWLAEPAKEPRATQTPEERRLVFVGRMVPEKGWRAFLDAVALCRERGFEGEAVLLGGGPDVDAVRARVAELGLSGVSIPGRVPPEVVAQTIRGGVLVNPTTASEGFQLTLVEAMASGAAIVTYAVGGTDEVSRVPGADVRVVPMGDAQALAEATWRAVGRPAPSVDPAVLAPWDWGHVADAYVEVLRDVSDISRKP